MLIKLVLNVFLCFSSRAFSALFLIVIQSSYERLVEKLHFYTVVNSITTYMYKYVGTVKISKKDYK